MRSFGLARWIVAFAGFGALFVQASLPARANDYVNLMLPFDARASQLGALPSAGWRRVQIQEVLSWGFVRAESGKGTRTALLKRHRDGTWAVVFGGANDPSVAQFASAGISTRRARLLLARCTPTSRNTIARARSSPLTFTGMARTGGRLVFTSTTLTGVAYSCP